MDISISLNKTVRSPEPVILPARMLNEYVYCPRLFYLEFVEGIFLHNADTLEGAAQHKRVDTGKGELPPAKKKIEGAKKGVAEQTTEREIIHSRSVSLFSERLGVTAKLDLVEWQKSGNGHAPQVCPVEYKKGAPREGDEGYEIWDADRMQLGLQIFLLRENGYSCDNGVIYYRENRQRVHLEYDEKLEEWIKATVEFARTAMQGERPPPLEDSPKCPRCSLVSVCLPDETRFLQETADWRKVTPPSQLTLDMEIPAEIDRLSQGPFVEIPEVRLPVLKPGKDVRRLIAPAADTRPLYLNTPGLYISKKGDCLIAKEKGKPVGEFRIMDVHHLALFGPISISPAVVHKMCERDIPITYFSMGGWFYGITRGHGLTNVFTRIEQFRQAADDELSLILARLFVHGKIRNQRTLLIRNHIEPSQRALCLLKYLARSALVATSLPVLLGIEGTAARVYFENFSGMIKSARELPSAADENATQREFSFFFEQRNRRPPKDPVNALLSLAYSLLTRDCTLASWSTGFDPYVGFYHQPRFGRPALALDVMEEFRPIVADSVVLTLINNRMLGPKDFVHAGDSVSLTPKGRKAFFLAYEKRLQSPVTHPVFNYKVSYRRAIELQFRLLSKVLAGEIEQYFPFTTR